MFDDNDIEPHHIFLAIFLSVCLIHLPLLYLLKNHNFDNQVADQLNKKAQKQVLMVDLKQRQSLPIADINKPKVDKIPDKASAQSLYNSSVKQETVSKNFSKQDIPAGVPTNKKTTQKPPANPKTMEGKLESLFGKKQLQENKKYTNRFESNKNTSPPLKTSIGSPMGGNKDDFLLGYKVGNRTYINTLAYPHIGYFVEFKKKYRFAWNPMQALRYQYQTNQISRGQLVVVWGVSVDQTGRLADLVLIKSSGHQGYDLEARRTIMVSSPYSQPPTHLLTKDNQLHMTWTFAFVVYL
ncbi:MAG: TonB C-terminal domain-containing protein [bacterium]